MHQRPIFQACIPEKKENADAPPPCTCLFHHARSFKKSLAYPGIEATLSAKGTTRCSENLPSSTERTVLREREAATIREAHFRKRSSASCSAAGSGPRSARRMPVRPSGEKTPCPNRLQGESGRRRPRRERPFSSLQPPSVRQRIPAKATCCLLGELCGLPQRLVNHQTRRPQTCGMGPFPHGGVSFRHSSSWRSQRSTRLPRASISRCSASVRASKERPSASSFSAMADSAAEHTLNSSKSRSCGSLFVTMILPLIILQRRDGYAPSGAKGFELFKFKRHMGNDSGRRAAFQIDHFIAVMVVVRREAIGGAPAVPFRHRGPRRRDALVRRCADGVRHALDRRAPVGGYARIGEIPETCCVEMPLIAIRPPIPKIRERVWFIFCWMASCVEIDFWINSTGCR